MWDILIALNMVSKKQVSISNSLGVRAFNKIFRKIVSSSLNHLQQRLKKNTRICSGLLINFTKDVLVYVSQHTVHTVHSGSSPTLRIVGFKQQCTILLVRTMFLGKSSQHDLVDLNPFK